MSEYLWGLSMLRDKLLAGGQRAAEIYCASQPQWEYIVPALILGLVMGAVIASVSVWWVLNKSLK